MLIRTSIRHQNHIHFQNIRRWFLSYAKSYYTTDTTCQYHIVLKRNHSLRVSTLAGLIGKKMNLGDEDVILAKTIGLLHDVGRFEQFMRYRTFIDQYSFDHGKYGADLLKRNNWLGDFSSSIQEIILSAISYHNKAKIPSGLERKHLLHTQTIRDADKLDILRITTQCLNNQCHLPEIPKGERDEVSETVLQALMNKEIISYGTAKNDIDFLLCKIAWVYDLNFIPSIQLLINCKYLLKIRRALPDTDEIHTVFRQIDAYLDRRLRS